MISSAIRISKDEALTFDTYNPINVLKKHCPLDDDSHGLHLEFGTAYSLGALAILPVELQLTVLVQLDLETLLAFRRINKRAMNLVESMIEWKKARDIFRCIQSFRIALTY